MDPVSPIPPPPATPAGGSETPTIVEMSVFVADAKTLRKLLEKLMGAR